MQSSIPVSFEEEVLHLLHLHPLEELEEDFAWTNHNVESTRSALKIFILEMISVDASEVKAFGVQW